MPFNRAVFSHVRGVYAAAFGTLSDGTPLVATGGGDSVIRLWDPATMTLRATLRGHIGNVAVLAFGTLPDGTTLLAAGDASNVVRLWNVGNMTVHAELPGHRGGVKSLCFGSLPDGTLLLATGDKGVLEHELHRGGIVWLWDPFTGRLLRPYTVVPGLVSGLAFAMTSDGSPLLAVGSNDGLGNGGVCVWNLATEEQVGEVGHNAIFAFTFCTLPDGSTLLVTADSWEDDEASDGNVSLWDTRTWKCTANINKKIGTVDAVASGRLPGGSTRLALGTRDGSTLLVDPVTAKLHAVLPGHDGSVIAMTFGTMPDGSPLLVTGAAAGDPTARVWDPTMTTRGGLDTGAAVYAVCFSTLADGTTLVATGEGDYRRREGYVRLRDSVRGQVRGTIPCHPRRVLAIESTTLADGTRLLCAGGHDGEVTLLDAATGNKLATFTVHPGLVTAIAFGQLADGTPILATGGYQGSFGDHGDFSDVNRYVQLRNVATTGLIATLTGHTGGGVSAIAFCRTPEDRFILAAGGFDTEDDKYFEYARYPDRIGGEIRLWDLDDMTLLGTLPGQSGGVTALAFASFPDGSTVLAAAGGFPECAVNLWDPFTRELRASLTGHTQRVLAAAVGVLADGTVVLATGGYDSTIRLWDPVTPRLLGSIPTAAPIGGLAFSQNSLAVATRRGFIMFDLLGHFASG